MADKATIKLLPRKEFEITLEDDTVIKGQFGTWALRRYCDKMGYTLKSAGEHLGDPGIGDILEYILAAVEGKARATGAAFSYNDVHVGAWIDELGGITSPDFVRLFNHSGEEQGTEKKTEEEAS